MSVVAIFKVSGVFVSANGTATLPITSSPTREDGNVPSSHAESRADKYW
jgi:hypothetical protein